MQDDIDFFNAENLELQSKVKEVCLQNAQLKIKIVQLLRGVHDRRDLQDSLSDGEEGEGIHVLEDVLTARNEIENIDEEAVHTAMFEVAKNNTPDDDQLGDDLDNNFNDQAVEDFVSEDSFREEV